MSKCARCGKILSSQDRATYRDRCEDCWCLPITTINSRGGFRTGELGAITNQDVKQISPPNGTRLWPENRDKEERDNGGHLRN